MGFIKTAGVLFIVGATCSACANMGSAVTDTPEITAYKQRQMQTQLIAQKARAAQNEYRAASQAYNEQKARTPISSKSALYQSYQGLLAAYSAAVTVFYPTSPGDQDPHLPIVTVATAPVTAERIKADYVTVAHDYVAVVSDFVSTHYALPDDLPPFPPIERSDKDYQRLANLEQTLEPARLAGINRMYRKKAQVEQELGAHQQWGADVPLGGLHTPTQPQSSDGWCQASASGELVPCN
jgi:hypothetical protein